MVHDLFSKPTEGDQPNPEEEMTIEP